jgi:hypothetical protein
MSVSATLTESHGASRGRPPSAGAANLLGVDGGHFTEGERWMEPVVFEALKQEIRRSWMGVEVIADRAEMSAGAIYLWLRGATKDPRLSSAAKVAAVLGKRLELSSDRAGLAPVAVVVARKPAPRMALWRLT